MNYSQEMKDKFKLRLKTIIGKKIETTMIASLNEFEIAFGHAWGHGKGVNELTADEAVYRTKYEEVRNRILNTGNRQKKNAYTEIDMHEVIWNRYKTEFLNTKDTY